MDSSVIPRFAGREKKHLPGLSREDALLLTISIGSADVFLACLNNWSTNYSSGIFDLPLDYWLTLLTRPFPDGILPTDAI